MKEVAPIVKRSILEVCSIEILQTDIRTRVGYYEYVVSWVDKIC